VPALGLPGRGADHVERRNAHQTRRLFRHGRCSAAAHDRPAPSSPWTTYLVTRRCAQRQFLLKPSKTTNQIFLYLLAVGAGRYGIQVHAFCVLSNHFHLIVTDPDARLPAFHQFLDSLVARTVNALLGRWESFWAPDSYSAVTLASPNDIVDKAAYVLANPVAAGLVRCGRLWPGLWSAPEGIGGEALEVNRPHHSFDPNGGLPDRIALAAHQASCAGSPRARSSDSLRRRDRLRYRRRPNSLSSARNRFTKSRYSASAPFTGPAATSPSPARAHARSFWVS
jgi:REP element-mobilizing transposase RayT